jgi:hypothetical protein
MNTYLNDDDNMDYSEALQQLEGIISNTDDESDIRQPS